MTVAVAAHDDLGRAADHHVDGGDRADLVSAVQQRYLPNAVLAWGEPYDSPLWEGRDRPAAYVCRDFVCGVPAASVDDLADQLGA